MMSRKLNSRNNVKARIAALFGLLLLISMASCVSYSYSGIVQADKLPDEGILGMTRAQLIDTYGMPDRITPAGENSARAGEGPMIEGQPPRPSMTDHNVIYLYRRTAHHTVILYQRARSHMYAVYFKDGKVSEVKTTLTLKGDGISFGGILQGAQGGQGGQGRPGGN